MADTAPIAQNTVDAAKHVFDATYKAVYDKTKDARVATEKAAHAVAEQLKGPGIATEVIATGVAILAELLAVAMDKITQVKKSGQAGIHDLIAATLSDALLIEVSAGDIPLGTDAKGQYRVNAALGGRFLSALKTFMNADGAISGDSAEKAVSAFMGFGMQLAVNTGLLAMIGGAIPFEHFNEIKEIGEMLEKSLGIGRLMRQLLAPYIQTLVQKPLTKQLSAKYRQDILGAHELIKAIFRGSPLASQARALLAQHGLPEDQINELVDQQRPHLGEAELDTLVWFGEMDQPGAEAHIGSAGVPQNIAQLKFRAITLQRLAPLRHAGMNEVLGFVAQGRLPVTAIESAFTDFGIPVLERDIWRARANYYAHVRRRELSKADVIFLYEHGQFTLSEVQAWALEAGYDPHDQLAIELEVLGKTEDFNARKTAAAQRKAKLNPLGYIDNLSAAGGVPELSGWATDAKHQLVKSVTILSDGAKIGDAQLGRPRPDVLAALGAGATPNAGWTFSGKQLTPGTHVLSAKATDNFGVSVVLPHTDGGTGVVNVQ